MTYHIIINTVCERYAYTCLSVRMVDVDGIAESILVDSQSRHVAVGNTVDELALLVVGLDIQSAVEMPGARFAEVTRQHDVIVHRAAIVNCKTADGFRVIMSATRQQSKR